YARQLAGGIDITLEDFRRLDFVGDPIQPSCNRRRVGDIRVGIRPRQPALDPQRRTVADHAKASGAIILAPGDTSRCPRARLVALVRGYIRRVAGRKLTRPLHPAAQEPAERVAGFHWPKRLIAGEYAARA